MLRIFWKHYLYINIQNVYNRVVNATATEALTLEVVYSP